MKTPRVLGVDDWAKRKGQSYGTILVDLENRRTIDLLPERSAASLSTWLKAHTGVEVISRDRGTEYIKGVTDGALAAIQVADRWHLLSNLKDTLKRMLEGKRVCLKAVAESDVNGIIKILYYREIKMIIGGQMTLYRTMGQWDYRTMG